FRGRQPARAAGADARDHGRRAVRRRARARISGAAVRRGHGGGFPQRGPGHLPPRRPDARADPRRRGHAVLLPDPTAAGAGLGSRSACARAARRASRRRARLSAVRAHAARCSGGGFIVTRTTSMVMIALALAAPPALAQPTRSSPLAVAPDGHVFVVNPDSNTIARLEFDAMHQGTLTHEAPVGTYPRTAAVTGPYVFTADQRSDTVSRRAQADLSDLRQVDLGFGCSPYGVAPIPGGGGVLVSCQGTSEAVLLDADLAVVARGKLPWPNARPIAVSAAGARA